jgi:hypothetical protein
MSTAHQASAINQVSIDRYESTFVVSPDPSKGDFTSLQPAIAALPASGGKIFVKAGVYLGGVSGFVEEKAGRFQKIYLMWNVAHLTRLTPGGCAMILIFLETSSSAARCQIIDGSNPTVFFQGGNSAVAPAFRPQEVCKLRRSCAAALLVFFAAAARTWFVPARLRRCPLDLERGCRWLQVGL